jgi:hypothetical protein
MIPSSHKEVLQKRGYRKQSGIVLNSRQGLSSLATRQAHSKRTTCRDETLFRTISIIIEEALFARMLNNTSNGRATLGGSTTVCGPHQTELPVPDGDFPGPRRWLGLAFPSLPKRPAQNTTWPPCSCPKQTFDHRHGGKASASRVVSRTIKSSQSHFIGLYFSSHVGYSLRFSHSRSTSPHLPVQGPCTLWFRDIPCKILCATQLC